VSEEVTLKKKKKKPTEEVSEEAIIQRPAPIKQDSEEISEEVTIKKKKKKPVEEVSEASATIQRIVKQKSEVCRRGYHSKIS